MKIKSIKIQNLGTYQDVKVDLEDVESRLVFINGNNGRGKTTFLNALKWCLFRGARPPISRSSIAEFGVSKPLEARVEIEVLTDDDQVLLVEKSQTVTVMDDGKTARPIGQPIISGKLRASGKPTIDIQDASQQVEELLPKRLENFILFDAEQLAKFFNPETRHAIEEAVYEIAGVEKLDLAITGIKDQIQKFQRDKSKLGGAGTVELQKKLEEAEKLFDDADATFNSAIREIEEAEEDLTQVVREIARYEHALDKLERLEALRAEVEALEKQVEKKEGEFNEGVINACHLFVSGDSLKAVDRFYDEGKDAGYPLAFPTESLRELLASDACVCGCDLNSSGHRTNIQELLRQQAVAEGVDKSLPSTKTFAMALRDNLVSERSRLQVINSSIAENGKELVSKRKELKTLEDDKFDKSDLERLFETERRLHARIRVKTTERNAAKSSRDSAQLSISKYKLELSKAIDESEKTKKLDRMIEFLTSCLVSAQETKVLAIAKVRSDLEQSMNDQYSNIKGGTYEVQITDSFGVQLRNQDSSSISEGETMSLAYAFAIAIRTALGMQFPLVVDSAFGKLDSENRLWLANSLVELVLEDSRRQAMFLMHNLEYTPSTAAVFRKAKPKELYLNHSAEADKTTIEAGIDPTWKTTESSPWFEESGTK